MTNAVLAVLQFLWTCLRIVWACVSTDPRTTTEIKVKRWKR